MSNKKEQFLKSYMKKTIPDIKEGDTVRVHQKIKETTVKGEEKERIQIFEGLVLAKKHGKGLNATITVRKSVGGVGVERIFPIHSPQVEKIEIVSRAKTRRSKLYYIRSRSRKKARLKKSSVPEGAEIRIVEEDEEPEEKPEEKQKESAKDEAKEEPKEEKEEGQDDTSSKENSKEEKEDKPEDKEEDKKDN